MPENNPKKSRRNSLLFCLAATFLSFLAVTIWFARRWFRKNFGYLEMKALLFTLGHSFKGANVSVMFVSAGQYIAIIIGLTLLSACALGLMEYLCKKFNLSLTWQQGKRAQSLSLLKPYRICALFLILCALYIALWRAWKQFNVSAYLTALREDTHIYEEEYVAPTPDTVSAPAHSKTKNLILIYLESMETTYASQNAGGAQRKNNYIPNLTRLANEYVSFSNKSLLGGFYGVTGTAWTMGALFSTTSGLPFSFPTASWGMQNFRQFAPGVVTLGDMLAAKGYRQEFLCGSDSEYAGRKTYFQQHGDHEIFDLFTAREKGYIPEDYEVWWGFEDEILYRIAKDELLHLSAGEQPFNLTMLTVDTHYPGGYVCGLCGDEYPLETANVIACADRQVDEFIRWCQAQDFYQDTVIVLLGDHPRMDTYLVEGVDFYDRTVYNCFINAEHTEGANLKNRAFTALDMFPTILSAMGFEIDNDRLGMGVNLFSGQETLCERMGLEALDEEFSKYSEYYIQRFA